MREKKTQFESVRILKKRWKDGTFSEILDTGDGFLGIAQGIRERFCFMLCWES